MNKREIRERIKFLKRISLDLDLITDDKDEIEILDDVEGAIDEAIFFYKEKLDELEEKIDYVDEAIREYEAIVYERISHRM